MTLANSDRMEMELETMMSERRWAAWSGPRGARVLGSTVVWLKAGLSILDYCLRLPLHLPSPACYSSIHSSHSLPLLDSSLPSYSVELPSTCPEITCKALIKFLEMMTKSFEITSCFLWHPVHIYHNRSGTATPITTGHLNNKSIWSWTLISESFQKKGNISECNFVFFFQNQAFLTKFTATRRWITSSCWSPHNIDPPISKINQTTVPAGRPQKFCLVTDLECCWGPVLGVYYI